MNQINDSYKHFAYVKKCNVICIQVQLQYSKVFLKSNLIVVSVIFIVFNNKNMIH